MPELAGTAAAIGVKEARGEGGMEGGWGEEGHWREIEGYGEI